jgi:hypothetical protein
MIVRQAEQMVLTCFTSSRNILPDRQFLEGKEERQMTKNADTGSNVIHFPVTDSEPPRTDVQRIASKRLTAALITVYTPHELTLDTIMELDAGKTGKLLGFPDRSAPKKNRDRAYQLSLSIIAFIIDNAESADAERLELILKLLDKEQTPDAVIQRIKKTGGSNGKTTRT